MLTVQRKRMANREKPGRVYLMVVAFAAKGSKSHNHQVNV